MSGEPSCRTRPLIREVVCAGTGPTGRESLAQYVVSSVLKEPRRGERISRPTAFSFFWVPRSGVRNSYTYLSVRQREKRPEGAWA